MSWQHHRTSTPGKGSTVDSDACMQSDKQRARGRTVCSGRVCLPRASARCILCRRGRFPVSIVLWWTHLCASSPHIRGTAFHPGISCATRTSPPAPVSTHQAEVAVRAADLLEKVPAGTDGRSRSSAVCGSASSQCTPLLGQHRPCQRSRPALLCFLARRRTCQRSRARWEIGTGWLSIVGWCGPRPNQGAQLLQKLHPGIYDSQGAIDIFLKLVPRFPCFNK